MFEDESGIKKIFPKNWKNILKDFDHQMFEVILLRE